MKSDVFGYSARRLPAERLACRERVLNASWSGWGSPAVTNRCRRYLKPHRVKCTGTLDKMSSSVECCRSSNYSSHFEMISRNLFFKAISAGLRPPASSQL
jgi:hypothetical protein